MNKKYFVLISIFIGVSIVATSCGSNVEPTPTVDMNAIMTEVAMTVEAEIAQAAPATPVPTIPAEMTPTLPLVVTQDLSAVQTQPAGLQPTMTVPVVSSGATQSAASPTGDDSAWVKDVTVSDYDIFYERESFKKVWLVKNTGNTTWDAGYALVNIDDNNWGEDVVVPLTQTVVPGTEAKLSIQLRAPNGLGDHWSRWFLMNPNGQLFGQELYVLITVGTFKDKTPTPAG